MDNKTFNQQLVAIMARLNTDQEQAYTAMFDPYDYIDGGAIEQELKEGDDDEK